MLDSIKSYLHMGNSVRSSAKTPHLNGRKVEQGKSDMPVLTTIGRLRKMLGMEIRLKDKIIGLPTDLKLSSNKGKRSISDSLLASLPPL
jgi:hypothetical protein